MHQAAQQASPPPSKVGEPAAPRVGSSCPLSGRDSAREQGRPRVQTPTFTIVCQTLEHERKEGTDRGGVEVRSVAGTGHRERVSSPGPWHGEPFS